MQLLIHQKIKFMVPNSYHSLNFLAKSKHLFLLLTMAIFTLGSVNAEHFSTSFSTTLNCDANAGALGSAQICLQGDQASIQASPNGMAIVPDGFQVIYVLTSGEELIINDVSNSPKFIVDATGTYTIHTLVYDPSTLDLGIVEFGVTTGFDVNGLLEQGGGDICASLDVPGAKFSFDACEAAFCLADAGTITPIDACLEENTANLTATIIQQPTVPENFEVIYVLTSGEDLVIENVNDAPSFDVESEGIFTIHTLVYDPATLDLGIVEIGVTTGVDVNSLLTQGGGDICAALDVAGAPFNVVACEDSCLATAGTLIAGDTCLDDDEVATLVASEGDAPNVPDGFEVIYVLTSGEGLVIENVNDAPSFDVESEGRFTIHTLVYDPATLDLGIVEIGVTTGVDVNNLLIQGGGDICAALDVAGAPFDVAACEDSCLATAGTLVADDACLDEGVATLVASEGDAPNVPDGFEIIYVLTSGEGLVIENVNDAPSFDVESEGRFTIHTLVYDPATLDLDIVEIGVTTGVDVNNLLIQGGGDICAALDVAGAPFDVAACEDSCLATAGTLVADDACLDEGVATLVASEGDAPNVPDGFEVIYVLTSGEGLVIENVNDAPSFDVESEGRFTIHTLVYDPATLDLGIVEIGVTTGVDVNNLLIQGGGDICAALDVAGAPFDVAACEDSCLAMAGTLVADDACLDEGVATLVASEGDAPNVPDGFEIIYVLTSGEGLVIENVNDTPSFDVESEGRFTIHTLVYDPATLDLGIVEIGVTTGVDVNNLLIQGGGDICAALDVAGAPFDVVACEDICLATAGTLFPGDACLKEGKATLEASVDEAPNVPNGYEVIYVLTSGEGLVIENVNAEPVFEVESEGRFTIHTLVYDPATLDLGIVEIGVTTGVDVNNLLIQGGGDICAALDVAGAPFDVESCVIVPCLATAGTLEKEFDSCFKDGEAYLEAEVDEAPNVPAGYEVLYVLTKGFDLVIIDVNTEPVFFAPSAGQFRVHTLVYDPNTLDLGIVRFGVTTGFDVNSLLVQGGGDICAALDVDGAPFHIVDCPCVASAGSLEPDNFSCISGDGTTISASRTERTIVPGGYETIYVLTTTDRLIIVDVSTNPSFTVTNPGLYTIHTLVYDPNTLDLGIVQLGQTTGFDVNGLLIQGGGDICASLDVAGASFEVEDCSCDADAGALEGHDTCLDGTATLVAQQTTAPSVPSGYQVLYVLTSGEGLVIEAVNGSPEFEVVSTGLYTIHTLVYDPNTLDLGIVQFGQTTGFDVNGLLIQGGGDICAALDVAGAPFHVDNCACEAGTGALTGHDTCLDGTATLVAQQTTAPSVPSGYQVLYVLTSGEGLVIEAVNGSPEFEVASTGLYTIHTLVYDPITLDLGIVQFGQTTGFDVNGLLIQGGGDICAALDVAGAPFHVDNCGCEATAGTLTQDNNPCLEDGIATIIAKPATHPVVPEGYEVLYVLTSGEGLVIEGVNTTPAFDVHSEGLFTIHTLVYNPSTLDLSIVEIGQTTGFDVNSLLVQGGGNICAALDVAGAPFHIAVCPCSAEAGQLTPSHEGCLDNGNATLQATPVEHPVVPMDFEVIYVLTSGEGLVIEAVNNAPEFHVAKEGRFTIHTLVYNPNTLDLGIVEFGVTTGVDVNGLLIQGGGQICGALDVAGAPFHVAICPCEATAGTLEAIDDEPCLVHGSAKLRATIDDMPHVPAGFDALYVLTSGEGLVIEAVNTTPEFDVHGTGTYTIHTLVYDPNTLDLGIVVFGETTGFDVNGLLIQGGGFICAALDVPGAKFEVETCADANGLGLSPNPTTGQIELDFQDASLVNEIEVQFLDMNGRLLNNRVFEGGRQKQAIDVSDLPGGVYNVQVWYDGKPTKIRKLLKR